MHGAVSDFRQGLGALGIRVFLSMIAAVLLF